MSLLPAPGMNQTPWRSSTLLRARRTGGSPRIGRAVRVQHHQEVAGRGSKPAGERVPLALPGLLDHDDARTAGPGHGDRRVRRVAVHQDGLVEPRRERAEDGGEVARLVLGRDDHTDHRLGPARPGCRWVSSPTGAGAADVWAVRVPWNACGRCPGPRNAGVPVRSRSDTSAWPSASETRASPTPLSLHPSPGPPPQRGPRPAPHVRPEAPERSAAALSHECPGQTSCKVPNYPVVFGPRCPPCSPFHDR